MDFRLNRLTPVLVSTEIVEDARGQQVNHHNEAVAGRALGLAPFVASQVHMDCGAADARVFVACSLASARHNGVEMPKFGKNNAKH